MSIFKITWNFLVIIFVFSPNLVKSKTIETTTITQDVKVIRNEEADEKIGNNKSLNDVANETCKGDPVYCNLTKEEYIEMLDNYIFPKPHEWGLIATHSVVFVIGLVGNALVCMAVLRNSSMRASVTYCCLVNLAVADFFVILLCLPPTVIWDVTETWFLGEALCKTLVYFQSVSVTVSVLTLTYIALDRYNAIVHPFSFHTQHQPIIHVKTAIFSIWLIALIFTERNCDLVIETNHCLRFSAKMFGIFQVSVCGLGSFLFLEDWPDLVYLTTTQQPLRFDLPHMVQCQATWSEHADLVWHIIKFIFMYTVPLLLVGGAYSLIVLELWKSEKIPGQDSNHLTNEAQRNSRRKVAKMLVAVVVMFAVCYLPVHVLAMLRYTGVLNSVEDNDIISSVALVSHILCYVNSAINPVIYNFMSEKFRHEFRRAFCCATGSVHEHSTTLTLTSKCKRSFEMQSLTQRTMVNDLKNGYT